MHYLFIKSINKAIQLTFLVFVLLIFNSCQSEYTKLVKSEIASGIEYDTILLNLKFGDSKSDFFKRCWELNKQKLISQGPNNNYVQYVLLNKQDSNRAKNINMLFYPKFDGNNNIKAMDFKFNYAGWAPWNERLHANKLMSEVKDTLLKWYPGNDFIQIIKRDSIKILVKVDGNRQISLFQEKNTRDVSVLIEDLRIKMKNN